MKVKWTKQALEGFSNISSPHFTSEETIQYKKSLVNRIEEKILFLGTSIPVTERGWEGSYKIIIDKYIVYYSFTDKRTICYIEYFRHGKQKR
jgi:hypothetical protein